MASVRVACVQSDVVFGDPAANARIAIERIKDLSSQDVQFAVFPEAFLTGYCVSTEADAARISIPFNHAAIGEVDKTVQSLNLVAILGFAEADGEKRYNSVVLLETGQPPRRFRKVHLPELGLDKFVSAGDELSVFETKFGRIGVLICFDMRAPEGTRVLALAGADIIVLPTNWPEGAETSANHICIARAAENRVFFASCNRAGSENGFNFIGRSKIIAPSGEVLAAAERDPVTIIADCDFAFSRQKRSVMIPDVYEITVFDSRRPDLYEKITEPNPPKVR